MKKVFVFLPLCLSIYACSPVSKRALNRTFNASENKFQNHTGFMLYDPVLKKELYEFSSDKYFTPASNTKIFTFYSALKIIGDSIPALRYISNADSTVVWGTGDPAFLYKYIFNNNRVFNFLKNQPRQLYFSSSNFKTNHFGKGWAWDDYSDYYSAEKSPLPIYGNIMSVKESSKSIYIEPKFFKGIHFNPCCAEKSLVKRALTSNQLIYSPSKEIKNRSWDIPFRVDSILISQLLEDTLKRTVNFVSKPLPRLAETFYSVPADSLYKVMMQESDNFIAEQLLLTCAGIISDTLKTEIAIDYIKKNYLQDLKDKAIWIDGSGLSRYNLFTPRTIVQIWEKIYTEVPRDRLFSLLAVGGRSGTLKNSYKNISPYIFGKTGTLSNNHNVSGYILTRSGKILIFAFMNNNYVNPTSDIRKNMEAILIRIRDNY